MDMHKNESEKIKNYLIGSLENNEFHKYLGIEMLELTPEYGRSKMKMKSSICNPYGSVHGGALMSIADTTGGFVACMSGKFVTTINSSFNFMLPGLNTEYIYCEARVLRKGKHLIVVELKLMDDDSNLIDSGEFTYFIMDQKIV